MAAGDGVAGRCPFGRLYLACLWVAQAGKSQRGRAQRDGKIGCRTAIDAGTNLVNRYPAHFGKCLQDFLLNGMRRIDVGQIWRDLFSALQLELPVSQHAAVFSGAVMPVWGGRFFALAQCFSGFWVHRLVDAAQQLTFIDARF